MNPIRVKSEHRTYEGQSDPRLGRSTSPTRALRPGVLSPPRTPPKCKRERHPSPSPPPPNETLYFYNTKKKKKRRRPQSDCRFQADSCDKRPYSTGERIQRSPSPVQALDEDLPQHNLAYRDILQLFLQLWDPYPAIALSQVPSYYRDRYQAKLVFPYAKLTQALTYLVRGLVVEEVGEIKYVLPVARMSQLCRKQSGTPATYEPPVTLERLRKRVLTLVTPFPKDRNVLRKLYDKVYGSLEETLLVEGKEFYSTQEVVNYALDTADKNPQTGAYYEKYYEPLELNEWPLEEQRRISETSQLQSLTRVDPTVGTSVSRDNPPLQDERGSSRNQSPAQEQPSPAIQEETLLQSVISEWPPKNHPEPTHSSAIDPWALASSLCSDVSAAPLDLDDCGSTVADMLITHGLDDSDDYTIVDPPKSPRNTRPLSDEEISIIIHRLYKVIQAHT
ncbi:hypothetical protein IWQ62_003449 [Dispira parvispora]|uniref:Uncharacterized protein n=1 Tax=Dispira parvispora TaxID=1520584 RepID=A0A9W8E2W8_9FUNG|nr:hypothetical protein IWQ62_003449 [Dispira parvispora]